MLIIAMIAVMFAVQAQTSMGTSNIISGNTYIEVGTDVQLDTTSAQYWLINAPQNWYTAQSVIVHLDSAGGDHTNVEIALYGRISDNEAWAAIGSAIDWAGESGDTVITISNTTENAYRKFKVLFTGTGNGSTKIDNREFKQYFGLP